MNQKLITLKTLALAMNDNGWAYCHTDENQNYWFRKGIKKISFNEVEPLKQKTIILFIFGELKCRG